MIHICNQRIKSILAVLLQACIFCSFGMISHTASAQWTWLNEPTGGYCYAIERVGSQIWAGTDNGIYYSTNEGITWNKNATLNDPVVDILAMSDTVILVIQQHPSLLIYHLSTIASLDGGNTFSAPSIAHTDSWYLTSGDRQLFFTGSKLVFNSNNEQQFSSDDLGQTWDTLQFPGTWHYITSGSPSFLLCYEPNMVNKGNYYSSDGGDTWNFLDSNYISGLTLIHDSSFYYVSSFVDTVTHYFIARTSDFGQTYDTLALDLLSGSGQLQYFNNKIYLSYYPYPLPPVSYESADGGLTWAPSAIPPEFYYIDERYAVLLSNWEWLLRMDGLYRFNTTSNVYYLTETGLNARSIGDLFINNGAMFTSADYGLMTSYDAGASWVKAPAIINPAGGYICKGDSVYMCSTLINNSYYKLMASHDNGITWDSVSMINGTHWKGAACMIEYHDKFYAANLNYTVVSSDYGLTWDSLSTYEDVTCSGTGIRGSQFAICNDELYMVDEFHKKVSKFDTISLTWKKSFCIPGSGVSGFELYSLDNYIAVGGSYRFYVSADSGFTWYAPLRNGLPLNGSNIFPPRNLISKNGVWFCTCLNDIYYSLDHGDNWQIYPIDPNMQVYGNRLAKALTELNGVLFASGNGIWKKDSPLEIITGKVYFDNNSNGVFDGSDAIFPHALLTSSPNSDSFTADANGDYNFLTIASGDSLKAALPTNFCSALPPWYITNGPATNIDFGIYFFPNILDLRVDMTNRSVFRNGFNTKIDIGVDNLGTVSTNSQLVVTLDSNLTYLNSSTTPDLISGNTLTFEIDTLNLIDRFNVTLDVMTAISAVINDSVKCTAIVNPILGDTLPQNNVSQISTIIVGAYDPNDKTCLNGVYITPSQVTAGDEISYIIRFQNVGNFQADNVSILDTLSQYFDLTSFRLISSSHPVNTSLSGTGIAWFNFSNIFLPAVSTDEPGSHGFVKYAIKAKPTVGIGTGITNTAHIYFDFNPAVITNTVSSLVAYPPTNVGLDEEATTIIKVFPNPTSNYLNILLNESADLPCRLEIMNALGQVKSDILITDFYFRINTVEFNEGIYFGRIYQGVGNDLEYFKFQILR